jgi:signal transduction histidine kinase
MRRLIADLRPTTLDELGLGAALEALAERLGSSEVIDVDLTIDLDFHAGRTDHRLLSEIEDAVFRLVQEALNNAARHGGAGRARVELSENGENLRVRVVDEGSGFDPNDHSDGFGLIGMQERVALAGGTLEVHSAPGEGTTITAVLPAIHRDEVSDRQPRKAMSSLKEAEPPAA